MATFIRAVDSEWIEPVEVRSVDNDERPPERVEYPADFLNWLMTEEERAKDDELDDQRRTALKFYNGEPFGDEEEGRSQIVTRDVAEVIDYMVPSVLRTMVSGDRVVEFEALDNGPALKDGQPIMVQAGPAPEVQPGQPQQSAPMRPLTIKEVVDQATEAVSQQFMQDQSGWRILHDSLKSGLLEKAGAIKCYVEEDKKRQERDVTASELVQLQANGIEITESEPIGQWAALDDEQRAMLEASAAPEQLDELGPMFRVAWIETVPRFVDTPMPNEEFGVATDARSLDGAVYYNHHPDKTISELAEMGLDVSLIGEQDGGYNKSELARARDAGTKDEDIHRTGPNRTVRFLEEYVRYDLNGDGIAEFLRVARVGRVILSVDEIDYGPCEEWCPFPMPHRRVGQSLADKVMDIQRTRSVLMRQAFDNLYQSNVPRMLVSEQSMGDSTIDDLLTFRPGALIRYKGGEAPRPLTVPFMASNAFQAMEVLTGERESRTGITRLNQGLDADALNKTATGTALMQAQGQQIEEYIARNFAEFIGRVFGKKYRLMKDFGRPFQIIVDGEPKTVDPSTWPDEMRVMVRVGLGSGNKQQQANSLLTMLNLQKEAAMGEDPHVGGKQIFNTVKKLVGVWQLGQATDYYADPDKMPPEEPTPPPQDPEVVKAQANMQIENARIQAKMQVDAAKNQTEMFKEQAKHQLAQNVAMAKLQLDQAVAEARAERERDRVAFEAQLAERNARFERELAVFKAQQGQGVNVPENRPGGDLDK